MTYLIRNRNGGLWMLLWFTCLVNFEFVWILFHFDINLWSLLMWSKLLISVKFENIFVFFLFEHWGHVSFSLCLSEWIWLVKHYIGCYANLGYFLCQFKKFDDKLNQRNRFQIKQKVYALAIQLVIFISGFLE